MNAGDAIASGEAIPAIHREGEAQSQQSGRRFAPIFLEARDAQLAACRTVNELVAEIGERTSLLMGRFTAGEIEAVYMSLREVSAGLTCITGAFGRLGALLGIEEGGALIADEATNLGAAAAIDFGDVVAALPPIDDAQARAEGV